MEEYGTKLPRRRIIWIEVAVLCVLCVVSPFVSGLLYGNPFIFFDWRFETISLVSSISLAALLGFVIWMSGDDLEQFGIAKPEWKKDWVPTLVAGFVGIGWWFFNGLMPREPIPGELYEMFNLRPIGVAQWALLTVTLILNSVHEELFFRGYLMTRFRELFGGSLVPIINSALAFGITHVYQGWGNAAFIVIFGLMFSAMFARWRRLWPLIFGHTLSNLLLYLSY